MADVADATLLLFRGLVNGQQDGPGAIGDEVLRAHVAAGSAHPHAAQFRAGDERVIRMLFIAKMGECLHADTAWFAAVLDDAGTGGGFGVRCHTKAPS